MEVLEYVWINMEEFLNGRLRILRHQKQKQLKHALNSQKYQQMIKFTFLVQTRTIIHRRTKL